MRSFLTSHHHPDASLQTRFDAAVVMTSMLRSSITGALASVLAQHGTLRIQVLIGIDVLGEDADQVLSAIEAVCCDMPPRLVVQLFYPGYSTSVRHGGLTAAQDGGALRTLLTHLANADHVAYIDDDNAWTPHHLPTLLAAVKNADYAFSLRWFADPVTLHPLAIDRWESVGPGEGLFQATFGGFVDPNTLMIRREQCREAIIAWSTPLPGDSTGLTADRMVFDRLKRLRGMPTRQATSLYRLNPSDPLHARRLRLLGHAAEDANVAAKMTGPTEPTGYLPVAPANIQNVTQTQNVGEGLLNICNDVLGSVDKA